MRLLVSALFCLLAVPVLAQDAGQAFKAWSAQCDSALYCTAISGANLVPGGKAYRLILGRHAQKTYWEVELDTSSAPADDWADFVVTVDDVGESLTGRTEIGAYGRPGRFFLLGDKGQVVLDRLVPGHAVRFDFNDKDGAAQSARFDLSGLAAALLFIDDRQGRIGAERVTFDPPYGLTPAGNEQVATPDVPVALLDRHQADPECEPLADLANGRDITVAALDADHTLYILPCWSGAYNFSSRLYVGSADSFEQLAFAEYSSNFGWSATTTLVNAFYDETDKTLSSFNKGRGIGDCGSTGRWQWQGFGFRMLEFAFKDDCDGEGEEAGDFPIVYSAPVEPAPAN